MDVVKAIISNRTLAIPENVELVCNNPTDVIEIEFDDEWSGKTGYVARFQWGNDYIDVPFTGNQVQVPEISNTQWVLFGVYADNLATAPAKIKCKKSILCYGDHVRNPPANPFYDEFCKRLEVVEKAGTSVGIADELPEPSESYRGKFFIVTNDNTDRLYICMRINGEYKWVEFSSAQTPEIDTETAELGKAILDMMKLA